MAILYIINSVQAIGDFTATTEGGLGREPAGRELSGGIIGNGLGSMIGACIGGLPTATFSQNVGIVVTTKVVAKRVFYMASGIILAMGSYRSSHPCLRRFRPACLAGDDQRILIHKYDGNEG
ncbi:MAG: solute carrier family 23 protein [[Clostridium] scindens]